MNRREEVDAAIREANEVPADAEWFHITARDRRTYNRACEDCAKACEDSNDEPRYMQHFASICRALKSDAGAK